MSYKEVSQFKELVKGGKFVVFDTETTGLSSEKDRIIEFSAIEVSISEAGGFSITNELDVFINPDMQIPEEIVEITGITNEIISEQGIDESEAFAKIKEFFGENPIICGYNISFDNRFMSELYKRNGDNFGYAFSLDVFKLAKEKLPKPHKLINVCEKFGLDKKYQFHRSIEDVKATLDVFLKLLPYYKEDTTQHLVVTGASRWNKHGYDRIYITNEQKASVFLDVNSGNWVVYGDYDIDDVKKAVYTAMDVSNDEELALKVA
nr:3'-5' exonuclease [uncultured Butyrivibrio sp.]